jgi:acyl-CoA synthetase (AMP-forming)/AMP-acid ligase II
LLRRDADGDYWFVDRLSDVIRTATRPVHPRAVEDSIYQLDDVALVCVYPVELAGGAEQPVAAIVPKPGRRLDLARLAGQLEARHPPEARPKLLRVLERMPLTDGFRPVKPLLQSAAMPADGHGYRYDSAAQTFVPIGAGSPVIAGPLGGDAQ